MKTKLISLILVFSFVMTLLAGCGAPQTVESPSTPESSVQSTEITITDHAGREVTLEKPAEKVVSAYYLSSSLLIAIGAREKVVGIEMKADTRELYKLAAPEFLELPAVGSGKGINVEETAALSPDLVVLPKKLADSAAQFEALNIPVIVIDPETLDTFLETVEMLGKATGCEEKADEFISYYKEVMEDVSARTKDLTDKPTVYLAGSDLLRTAGKGMYQDDLITLCGGVNAAGSIEDSQWVEISAEQLLSWNPSQVYLVSYCESSKEDFAAQFGAVDAVKNDAVFTFPSNIEPWDYPTASSVLGILWLANALHPDVVTADEVNTATEEFYQNYFGISVSVETAA